MIHKVVNKCITPREEYELWEHNPKEILWTTLKYISDNLVKYKDAKNLYDFNDLVDLTIKSKDKDVEEGGDDEDKEESKELLEKKEEGEEGEAWTAGAAAKQDFA